MKSFIERHPLAMYFILAIVITWLILGPGVASTLGFFDFEFDGIVLSTLGQFGPLLAALIVTGATVGSAGVRKIFRSMFNWRVKARWWAAAVLLLAGLFVVTAALGMLTSGTAPKSSGAAFLIIFGLLILIGSFGEEPGWRGFALPKLQQGRSAWKATLILSLFWWLWHIPFFFTLPPAIESAQQFGFIIAFGIQFLIVFALGILCAWVYNGSGGSVLMAVLMHTSWNFWLLGFSGQPSAMLALPLFLLAAIVVGFATKGKLGLAAEEPTNAFGEAVP
jgi:membrane protease YdiL (CAAX protease family)